MYFYFEKYSNMISAAQVGRQIFTKNGEDCKVDVTQVVPIDATQADSR